MLIEVTATAIAGRKLTGTTQTFVVNSENMYDWQTYGTGSRFRYVMNPNDRRDKALLITVSESIASLLSAANTAWGDIMVKLPVVTAIGGTATDRYVPVKSITWGEGYGGQSDYCHCTYNIGGFKSTTVLIPFSLNDLTYVASTGTSSS